MDMMYSSNVIQVLSGVKPAEKKKFINELQEEQKKVVAMVGDGINDAAALATCDIGVAMGGGVGAASEVSSIVLMGNRLSQVFANLIIAYNNQSSYENACEY